MFSSTPFDFDEEYKVAHWQSVSGKTEAPIVAYQTLLKMKVDAGRAKDLFDIDALRKLDPYR